MNENVNLFKTTLCSRTAEHFSGCFPINVEIFVCLGDRPLLVVQYLAGYRYWRRYRVLIILFMFLCSI